ncbi:MAG: hypothetical protein ACJ77U_10765 [Chloroflexota bacterium]
MTPGASVPLHDPIEPAVAAGQLADWGFLAHADLPDAAGDAYLLVALRDRPTFRHFDPETVELWVTRGGRGVPFEITRSTPDLDLAFSWGTVRIVDRLDVSNEYVVFGGRLTTARVGGMVVVSLVSPAPILRRGGHSQGWDEAAVDLAAFFGRVMVAVDYVPGFEARMAAAHPVTRYAAFVCGCLTRYGAAGGLQRARPALWRLIRGEADRLRTSEPVAWAAGVTLAADATDVGTA